MTREGGGGRSGYQISFSSLNLLFLRKLEIIVVRNIVVGNIMFSIMFPCLLQKQRKKKCFLGS